MNGHSTFTVVSHACLCTFRILLKYVFTHPALPTSSQSNFSGTKGGFGMCTLQPQMELRGHADVEHTTGDFTHSCSR